MMTTASAKGIKRAPESIPLASQQNTHFLRQAFEILSSARLLERAPESELNKRLNLFLQ